MAEWLRGLPKPIGVMSSNDERGREVLDAAQEAGIPVPDDLAVVGVDNDNILCELCDPPLSSVEFNLEKAGYDAACLMHQMIRGEVVDPSDVNVQPLRVVSRRSSDVYAMDDRKVAQALGYIRDHATDSIRVSDVLRAVPISRRALEIRFKQTVHRTINAEILRAHLQHAKLLLATTTLPVEEIAHLSGFSSNSYMGDVFKKRLGTTPARFRKNGQS